MAPEDRAVAQPRVSFSRFHTLKKTLKHVLAEYGRVAVVVYLAIFTAVLGGFWMAIRLGWQPSSAAGSVGAFTAAYLATKVTQPLRIAATLATTPFVARAYERLRGRAAVAPVDQA